ncbi:MAG: sensor histidine kinase [Firmicutes bacterium]|nr:sensor histidine kinase [Bacillota bacterium]
MNRVKILIMKLLRLFTDTLRGRMSVSLILLVISAVSAIGITSMKIAQQAIKSHTVRFGGKILTQAAFRLGSMIDSAQTTVESIVLDQRLAPLLKNLSAPDGQTRITARLALYNLLIQYKAALLPGSELTIVDHDGNLVTTCGQNLAPSGLIPADISKKLRIWRLQYLPGFISSEFMADGRFLELIVRIVSLPGRPQNGWVVLHLDYRIVESIMTNISLQDDVSSRFQSDVVVFGPEGKVIFPWIAPSDPILTSAFQKLSGQIRNIETIEETSNGENFLVIAMPVPWTSWEVYIKASTNRLYMELNQIYNGILIIGLICALVAVFFAAIITHFVSKPINKLRNVMRLVEEGDLTVRAPEDGPLEIRALGRSFNRMLREMDRLTKRLVAEENEKRTAVIKTLQAQIAPHFLFNSLAAMAGMAIKRPPAEVAEALLALKRLLYLSIGKNGDFVTLADEFEHIRHYIYLMNIRYPGRFSLQMELPEKLRHCRIIRLVLQPIVENSVYHGFKLRGGVIRVAAFCETDDVIIQIMDNGQGMPPGQLDAVWKQGQSRSGIGIRNVDERIKLSFGPNYGLAIVSSLGEGTTVSLRIPYMKCEG